LHGWVYDINDGIINDLGVNIKGTDDMLAVYKFD
jgi:carbonic anhydrase